MKVTDNDLILLQSLHYTGWEHPNGIWDNIPEDLVRKGLDGLGDFIRIVQWSKTGIDPQTVINELPF